MIIIIYKQMLRLLELCMKGAFIRTNTALQHKLLYLNCEN